MIKLIECPRDAMQGIKEFIPSKTKAAYINTLLKVGYDTIDFGSFVSPKAIPQMKDTADVLSHLDLSNTKSKLLSIIANTRGANDACQFEEITYLGYPFSVSETFQIRNTNSTIAESLHRVKDIFEICQKHNKILVVYVSMGFGNPYGDEWNVEIVQKWVDILADIGIKVISLSDTIGAADKETITYLFGNLIPPYPDVEFGAHLHTLPHNWEEKVNAAYENNCLRFDGALKGFGGCPMAKDDLTGNMPTENLIQYFKNKKIELGINNEALLESLRMADQIFPH